MTVNPGVPFSTSTQPMPSRPGFLSTRVKTTNQPGFLGAADQGLDPVEPQLVADMVDIGLVVGDVGAGIGLGHADRQQALAAAHRRQDAPLDRLGRVGRDDPGLRADLAQHRHRGDVADLGDLLEDQRGVEHRQTQPAIFLRHRHAEHAEAGQRLHVLPGKGAVLIARRALAEFALRQLADRRDKLALLVAEGWEHGVLL